ncbi:MAG: PH domain-containing protein [Corynebacterium sp.]|nr:PH domain-containing protein [Corynebacterium sp.]
MSSTEYTFRTNRMHLFSFVIMELMFLMAIGWAPKYLFWLLFIPLIFIYAVLRSYTVVNDKGITAHYAFKGPRSLDWDHFDGIRFGRGGSFARSGKEEFSLPGISFNSLPTLSKVSNGRITDVIGQAHEAAADKVVVIHRDGYQVLKNKDEVATTDETNTARN